MEIIAYAYKQEIGIKEMAYQLVGLPNSDVKGFIPMSVVEAVYSMCESIECGYLPAKGYNLNSNGDWWLVEGTVLTADVAAWAGTRGMKWPPIIREPSTNLWTLNSTLRHPAVVAWAKVRGINWPCKKRMPKPFTAKNPQIHTQADEQAIYQKISEQAEQRRQAEAGLVAKAQEVSTVKPKIHGNAKIYAANREAVIKAAREIYDQSPELCGSSGASWAREVVFLEDKRFENGKCPMSEPEVARLINKSIKEGLLPKIK